MKNSLATNLHCWSRVNLVILCAIIFTRSLTVLIMLAYGIKIQFVNIFIKLELFLIIT